MHIKNVSESVYSETKRYDFEKQVKEAIRDKDGNKDDDVFINDGDDYDELALTQMKRTTVTMTQMSMYMKISQTLTVLMVNPRLYLC